MYSTDDEHLLAGGWLRQARALAQTEPFYKHLNAGSSLSLKINFARSLSFCGSGGRLPLQPVRGAQAPSNRGQHLGAETQSSFIAIKESEFMAQFK